MEQGENSTAAHDETPDAMPQAPSSVPQAPCSVIIVAAGSSTRMGFNKLLAPLAGRPVLWRAIAAFEECQAVAEIVIVGSDELHGQIAQWRDAAGFEKITRVIAGGEERHFSVHAGLRALSATCGIVAVHDGARPLITPAQITRCVEAAREHGAAACARRMTETLKRCDGTGRIIESIDRMGVWVMETPQVFQRDLLERAYEKVLGENLLVTDEVSAMQSLGHPVQVVENHSPNPKITFPSDLVLAEKLLRD